MLQNSKKLNRWIKKNSHYDGFWDFMTESLSDEQRFSTGEYPDELFDRGFGLAVRAGSKPVYVYEFEDDELESYLEPVCYYFIGEEAEVLTRLQTKLDEWLKAYPQEDESQKKITKLRKELEDAERKLMITQTSVDYLKNSLRETESKATKKKRGKK